MKAYNDNNIKKIVKLLEKRNRFMENIVWRCGKIGIEKEETLNSMTMVVEGIRTCEAAYKYAQSKNLEMPIISAVYEVLFNKMDPDIAKNMLLGRSSKPE